MTGVRVQRLYSDDEIVAVALVPPAAKGSDDVDNLIEADSADIAVESVSEEE